MGFNSLTFAVFFLTVYLLYLLLSHKAQNRLLLVASYIFYGFWDWRFLSLILLSTTVDYFCGLKIDQYSDKAIRKRYLWISIGVNLSILFFFKYFNFFVDSFFDFTSLIGFNLDSWTL
ncbi:MAG: hypothetical protein P9M15_02335, partial [Candidatus Electryoneaceae bacterium]|nr:hypothetical protein [Candidatus Electryoneaceae bacterium]